MTASWFYAFMLAAVGLTGWIGTQQLAIGVLMMDYGVVTFWGHMPAAVQPAMLLLNAFMLVNVWFFRPFSPSIN